MKYLAHMCVCGCLLSCTHMHIHTHMHTHTSTAPSLSSERLSSSHFSPGSYPWEKQGYPTKSNSNTTSLPHKYLIIHPNSRTRIVKCFLYFGSSGAQVEKETGETYTLMLYLLHPEMHSSWFLKIKSSSHPSQAPIS